MLRIVTHTETFHNLKCGEIYCVQPYVYQVDCCICGLKFAYADFMQHFQLHLLFETNDVAVVEQEEGREQKQDQEQQQQHPEECQTLEKDNLVDLMIETLTDKELQDEGDNFVETEQLAPVENETEAAFDVLPLAKEALVGAESVIDFDKCQFDYLPEQPEAADGDLLVAKEDVSMASETDLTAALKIMELEYTQLQGNDFLMDNFLAEIDNTIASVPATAVVVPETEPSAKRCLFPSEKPKRKSRKKSENNSKEKPCPHCDLSYKTRSGMRDHLLKYHPTAAAANSQQQYKCDQCEASFRIRRDLRVHQWKHTGLSCDICGKSFSQPCNLESHKLRHTGVRAHQCQGCDRSFFTAKELRSHALTHNGQLPTVCEVCGKRLRDKAMLKCHMRRHTGERPAQCDICLKRFYSDYDLKMHRITHSKDQRPFVCDICSADFQSKKSLRLHSRLHTQLRHTCCECGRTYTQAGALKYHMKRSHKLMASEE